MSNNKFCELSLHKHCTQGKKSKDHLKLWWHLNVLLHLWSAQGGCCSSINTNSHVYCQWAEWHSFIHTLAAAALLCGHLAMKFCSVWRPACLCASWLQHHRRDVLEQNTVSAAKSSSHLLGSGRPVVRFCLNHQPHFVVEVFLPLNSARLRCSPKPLPWNLTCFPPKVWKVQFMRRCFNAAKDEHCVTKMKQTNVLAA